MLQTKENNLLGQKVPYPKEYDPTLLFPIPRHEKREEIGLSNALPFIGYDLWRGYELSWLNAKGKPEVALLEFKVPLTSPNIVESKSLKLYLNSFNQTRFTDLNQMKKTLERDLSNSLGVNIQVSCIQPKDFPKQSFYTPRGILLDNQDIEVDTYDLNPKFLRADTTQSVSERYYSHLFKANCLVTGQPDFATVEVAYQGPKIDPKGLLQYLISFREHNEFHEQCVERLFVDIMHYCHPKELLIFAQFTRRGGIDISPFRSTVKLDHSIGRSWRQ